MSSVSTRLFVKTRAFLSIVCATCLMVTSLPSLGQFMPVISSISPTSGAPGTIVTITGSNLSSNSLAVYFNGVRGTIVTLVSNNSITVRVPNGARSGFITLVNMAANTLRQSISSQYFNVTFNGGSFGSFSFNPPVNVTMGANSAPGFLELADMDGDGKLDILAARNNLPIGILRNTTSTGITPSFAAVTTMSNNNTAQSFVVHDFNNDGTLDIFQTLIGANVLQGVGVPNYSTSGNIVGGLTGIAGGVTGPNQPMRGTAVGDMGSPRDGKADILWVAEANQTISTSIVYTNQNTSSFSTITNRQIVSFSSNSGLIASASFRRCWDVKAADFDGDGLADVATYETGTGNSNNLLVNRNSATGFSLQVTNAIPLGVASPQNGRMAVADIDSDGKPDLILAVSSVSYRIFRNTSVSGTISFVNAGNFAADIGNKSNFAVGDVTGDGKPDLVISRNVSNGSVVMGNMTILPNTTTGTTISFGTAQPFSGPAASDVCVGDINNDGYPDIVTSSSVGNNVNIYMNTTGTVPQPVINSFTPATGTQGTVVTITGQNFTGATAVRFNNLNAAAFTVVSASQITATVPGPGSSGTISVLTPGGSADSENSFTYFNAPTITSFTPRQAESRGTITIFGSNLNNVNQVLIGGRNASFTIVNNNTITAGIPSNGATGSVAVSATNGPLVELPGFTFVNSLTELEACVTNPLSITASVTGLSYQWQADPFNGFANLTDGAFATGTNSSTLNLIGAGPNFSGYRFRCIVNGVPTPPVTLRYYTYFTGSVDNVWGNAANWSCGIPGAFYDAVIPSGTVNLSGTSNVVRKIHARAGSTVNVTPGASLTISQ